MRRHHNLISNSNLINDTIELLKECGGKLPATVIAEYVLQIPDPNQDLAVLLASDLVAADPRLNLRDDHVIELASPNFDARSLAETDFVVFDLETTGAKASTNRVTEIGAYKVSGGRIVDEFDTLVNPQIKIPSFISALTGITDRMVEDAPLFAEVAPAFLDFIGDSVLVAHNAPFDMRFLNFEIGRVFREYEVFNQHLCTVRLSRKLLPDLINHRLHTVAEHFSIPIINRHRAGGDALATAKIFVHLLERLHERGVRDVAAARRFRL